MKKNTNLIVEQHIKHGMANNLRDSYGLLTRLINADWEFAIPEFAEYARKMRSGESYDEEALWDWAETSD